MLLKELEKFLIYKIMKSKIIYLLFLVFINSYSQFNIDKTQDLKNYIPINYEINQIISGKFDNDKLTDYLLILNIKNEKESYLLDNRDSITKRKVIILKGLIKKGTYKKIYENDDIIPCRECGGKSDNLYDSLSIKKGIFIYKTCEAPLAQDSYKVKKYELEFYINNFKLINYSEKYYKNPEDDEEIIFNISKAEIFGENYYPFNYYKWDWTINNNILISKKNVEKINNIAYDFYKKNNYLVSLSIFNKIIEKFPIRTVAYLNIADCYWELKDKEKAKANYNNYIDLMKSQKKDVKKIPKYVYERIK